MSKTEIIFRTIMSALAVSWAMARDWFAVFLSIGIVWAIWSSRGELTDTPQREGRGK